MNDLKTNNWIPFKNDSYYYQTGQSLSQLTILSDLFLTYSSVLLWKIELVLNLTKYDDTNIKGLSSVTFYVNQPPTPGTCDIEPKNGTTNDLFTIFCDQWSDDYDGNLVNFTFYCKKQLFK